MTDSRMFRSIAINKKTGEWKTFWHLFPIYHVRAARNWLRSQ